MSISSRLERVTMGAPTLPLVVLFGLNAVDELDRAAFAVLTPEIKDAFDLSNQGVLGLASAFGIVGLILSLPIAHLADRRNRIRMARRGAVVWASFSVVTGLAPNVGVLMGARLGSGLGKAVNEPTHNSLLADWYPPDSRGGVYYLHRLANTIGQFAGPLIGGVLAGMFTWRTPFFVFAVPTVVFVLLGSRLQEPRRGTYERAAAGVEDIEEDPLPFREAWRALWHVRALRRTWFSLPFLTASMAGLGALMSIFWEEVYDLSSTERGVLEATSEVFQLLGLGVAATLVQRTLVRDPSNVVRLMAGVSAFASLLMAGMALSPVFIGSVVCRIGVSVLLVALIPGIYTVASMVLPPRCRSLGFSSAFVWAIPGIAVLPIAGGIGDAHGLRAGMLTMLPVYLVGAAILWSAAKFVPGDIVNNQAREAVPA